ncbi:MAG TPA: hypothetical protein VGN34_21660 [Ktedonobacteraceae bacterium]|jgi:hypothetical protein
MNSQHISVDDTDRRGLLLTASATTGWLDWIHGELWLLPTGLLRIPLNLGKTILHGVGPTVDPYQPRWRSFDEKTIETLLGLRGTRWVPHTQLRKAYLHQGVSTDRLLLQLQDQRTVKLLWLPVDGAFEPLQKVLTDWLGNELVID